MTEPSSLVSRLRRRRILRELGFYYATLVGLVVGLPLSTGRVRKVGDLIVLTGLPTWVFRRGGTTVGRVYLTRTNDSPAVLRHEQVHVEQWRRLGLWMPILYALAGRDPLKNRFEIEAGLEDGGYVRRGSGSATGSGPGTTDTGTTGAGTGAGTPTTGRNP